MLVKIQLLILAAVLFVGRWSPYRLTDANDVPFYTELRFLIVLMLLPLSIYFLGKSRSVPSSQKPQKNFLLLSILLFYMLLSSFWSPDLAWSTTKILDLLVIFLTLGSLFVLVSAHNHEQIVRGFWHASMFFLVILLIVASWKTFGPDTENISANTRIAVLGGGPNVFGRNMALLSLLCLVFAERNSWKRLIYCSTALLAALFVILTGSRGAMLALFTGFLVYVFAGNMKFKHKVLLGIGLPGIMLLIMFFTPFGEKVYEVYYRRFVELLLIEQYTTNRVGLYQVALLHAAENPLFGIGLNGFGYMNSQPYPHNIFLEVLCEGGLIGLSILGVIFLSNLWTFPKEASNANKVALTVFFISAMFSGDLYDSRGLFFVLLLMNSNAIRQRVITPANTMISNTLRN